RIAFLPLCFLLPAHRLLELATELFRVLLLLLFLHLAKALLFCLVGRVLGGYLLVLWCFLFEQVLLPDRKVLTSRRIIRRKLDLRLGLGGGPAKLRVGRHGFPTLRGRHLGRRGRGSQLGMLIAQPRGLVPQGLGGGVVWIEHQGNREVR